MSGKTSREILFGSVIVLFLAVSCSGVHLGQPDSEQAETAAISTSSDTYVTTPSHMSIRDTNTFSPVSHAPAPSSSVPNEDATRKAARRRKKRNGKIVVFITLAFVVALVVFALIYAEISRELIENSLFNF